MAVLCLAITYQALGLLLVMQGPREAPGCNGVRNLTVCGTAYA